LTPKLLFSREYWKHSLFLLRIILHTLVQQGCTNPERLYFVQWHQILVDGTSFMLIFRRKDILCAFYISVQFSGI